ncbi:MAG: GNAT family N-acetyltransferase [Dehalococcoidales bacterium]|nr:GNAT family N-acetyltransferase [Dehalococcoidales bacterium]
MEITISISSLTRSQLIDYGKIPMKVTVTSRFVPEHVNCGLGGIILREEAVPQPYEFDYDALDKEGPTRWLTNFQTANWGLFTATINGSLIGGAAVAYNTPGVHMLFGRNDLAALWDIRVLPEYKRKGIGSALFRSAVKWAKERNCSQLSVETQNINVPACRFYQKQGGELGVISRYQYLNEPAIADQIMLIWYLSLIADR